MLEEKLRVGINVRYTSSGVDQEGLIDEIVGQIEKHDLDIYLGPEFLFMFERNITHIYDEKEKGLIFGEIAERTKHRDSLIIPGSMVWHDEKYLYNTAPIISEGKIQEYHKKADGGTALHAEFRNCKLGVFMKGDLGFFDWKDFKFGLSICADRMDISNFIINNDVPLLDFYMLTSCGCTLLTNYVPVRLGGFGLCSDGSSDLKSEVWEATGGYKKFDTLKPDKTIARPYEYKHSLADAVKIGSNEILFNTMEEVHRQKEAFHIYELGINRT
ncbi:MAG: hypothetical protein L6408_05020 [Nanoarchaeota archaeon]|nr:hypothetical protein [Nanoarchaeota archaeon]